MPLLMMFAAAPETVPVNFDGGPSMKYRLVALVSLVKNALAAVSANFLKRLWRSSRWRGIYLCPPLPPEIGRASCRERV